MDARNPLEESRLLLPLTEQNYRTAVKTRGRLVSGIAEEAEGTFSAYILNADDATILGYHRFTDLGEALALVNDATAEWDMEAGGCGSDCGAGSCSSECATLAGCDAAEAHPAH